MTGNQYRYVVLWESLRDYQGADLYADLLQPWLEDYPPDTELFERLGTSVKGTWPDAELEDLWELYAFARVNEALLQAFQPDQGFGWSKYPPIRIEEYLRFMKAFGVSISQPMAFHPFYHEIVSVESAVGGEPLTITGYAWPCLMFGSLMFSRAGCLVRGGDAQAQKSVAESATLYWATVRRNRPCRDQSFGRGASAQWEIAFRRDYLIKKQFHFNVDGRLEAHKTDPSLTAKPAREGLSVEERIELLRNRCFVTCAKNHLDLHPYDDRYSEPALRPQVAAVAEQLEPALPSAKRR